MLKQIRHISEGNFYGLRVTNKARKLSLDKEIRTLEACKDVQSHVYRKEEKELLSALKRLQLTKQDHFEHHEDYEQQERLASHHDRRPSFDAKQHSSDEHRPLRRPTERQDRKLQVKVKSELGDQRSSVKVCAGSSDVSVIISLSPIASSTNAAKQPATATLPSVSKSTKREGGTDIHRTQAFMSCVICNLPRYAQGREYKQVCTCHANPSEHPHHNHEHKQDSKKRGNEEDLQRFAVKRGRRRSLEVDDFSARHAIKQGFTNSTALQRNHGRSRASSFENDNESHTARGFDEYTAYVPGVGAHRRSFGAQYGIAASTDHEHDHGKRGRGNAFVEPRSRKNSLDEGRSRRSSYAEGRSRGSSYGEHDEPHYMRSRHKRTKQEAELHDLYKRLQRVFPLHDRQQYPGEDSNRYHTYTHYPGDHPHATHPPLFKSHKDTTSNDQDPAFHGLLHPDNVINHHHFLPHEAHRQDKPRSTSYLAPHHPTGYHVLGIDRHGNRQEVSRQFIECMKFLLMPFPREKRLNLINVFL